MSSYWDTHWHEEYDAGSAKLFTMKSTKPTTASKPHRPAKVPSHQAIIRAVASSTAIETGKSVRQIENSLLGERQKLRKVALAG